MSLITSVLSLGMILQAAGVVELPDMSKSTVPGRELSVPYSVAHRGCHIDALIPENSTEGVRMAAKYGFRAIECDAHYTSDSVIILMHDQNLNRTCRLRKGYAELTEPVKYSRITFRELRSKYVLASDDPRLRTKVPTLKEELRACRKYNVIPMMHSDLPEAYAMAHKILGDRFIAFSTSYESMCAARKTAPGCMILWDPGWTCAEEVIAKLDSIGGRCGISSMKRELLTAEYVSKIKAAGYEVQASIFKSPYDIEGLANGCTIALSDFCLFPAPQSPVRNDASDTRELSAKVLGPGESVEFSWDTIRYGSTELMIELDGSVDITINGERVYSLEGNAVTRQGGWRFHDKAPSIRITAKAPTTITRLTAHLYTY